MGERDHARSTLRLIVAAIGFLVWLAATTGLFTELLWRWPL